jgi:peptidyl-prolyl cis-trans isomerase B (cyclophilin B)
MRPVLLSRLLTAAVLAGAGGMVAGCSGPESPVTHEQRLQEERETQAAAIALDEKAKADALAGATGRLDKLEAEKLAAARAEAEALTEKQAAEEAITAEKLAAEQAAAERLAAENAANQAAEKAAADRAAAEKAAADEAARKLTAEAAMAAEKARQSQVQGELQAGTARAAGDAGAATLPQGQTPVIAGQEDLSALVAEITTSKGPLVLAFRPDKAPRHVQNFVDLARKGFYDGLNFHRIIPGFMIQGGDPQGDGSGGPGYQLVAEFNDLPHVRGTLSMARKAQPDTAGSQFFICHADTPVLDRKYSVFGRLVTGFETLDAIAAVGSVGGTPSETVKIEKVVIRPGRPDELQTP